MKIKLDRIILATKNTDSMAKFYNDVFESDLEPFEAYGTTLYKGKLSELDFLLCPNEVARVNADQNRHQLRFEVNNLTKLAERVLEAGGKFTEGISEDNDSKSCALKDPDGNTIELIEIVG